MVKSCGMLVIPDWPIVRRVGIVSAAVVDELREFFVEGGGHVESDVHVTLEFLSTLGGKIVSLHRILVWQIPGYAR